MRNYVLGFVFSPDLREVYLIRKNRPEWQRGLLNGIGGKIEQGETDAAAMHREAFEESGYTGQWVHYADMGESVPFPDWRCPVFYSILAPGETLPETREDEQIECIRVSDVPALAPQMIGNIPALIFGALHRIFHNPPHKPHLRLDY